MKKHVKDYLDFWGYDICDAVTCDISIHLRDNTATLTANDIIHIDPKGMGGRDAVEFIENYLASIRLIHIRTEGRFKDWLYAISVMKILTLKPLHDFTEKFKKTAFYNNHVLDYLHDRYSLLMHLNEIIRDENPFSLGLVSLK